MSALAQFIELYKSGKVSASTLVKAAAFKDELEKQALGTGVEMFLKYGMGIAAAGIKAGVGLYDQSQIEGKKKELFEDVIKLHPDLANDRKTAMLYFDALLHFSPQVATNALTAGAYIRQALQYHHVAGGPLPASVNELTQIQKQTMNAKKDAPTSLMGTIFSGITETPIKMVPSLGSYGGL
jgi:hypothetical protein